MLGLRGGEAAEADPKFWGGSGDQCRMPVAFTQESRLLKELEA